MPIGDWLSTGGFEWSDPNLVGDTEFDSSADTGPNSWSSWFQNTFV